MSTGDVSRTENTAPECAGKAGLLRGVDDRQALPPPHRETGRTSGISASGSHRWWPPSDSCIVLKKSLFI